jgi:hypothetical protein
MLCMEFVAIGADPQQWTASNHTEVVALVTIKPGHNEHYAIKHTCPLTASELACIDAFIHYKRGQVL